jgi:hypothetical protein
MRVQAGTWFRANDAGVQYTGPSRTAFMKSSAVASVKAR